MQKLIVISDLHGAFDNLEKVLKYAIETKQNILFCGDVIGYPNEEDIPGDKNKKEQLILFKQYAKKQWKTFVEVCEKYPQVQIFSVLGNYDFKSFVKDKKFAKNNFNVEANSKNIQNLKICGCGGADYIVSFLRRWGYVRNISLKNLRTNCDIFISHEPVFGYGDISSFIIMGGGKIIVFPMKKDIEALKKLAPDDSLVDLLIDIGDLEKEDLKKKKQSDKEQKIIDFLKNLKKKDVQQTHVGKHILKKFIENNKKIKLFVAGHIHSEQSATEVRTMAKIKPGETIYTTLVLNPGPLMEGNFAEVEISKRKVRFVGFGKIE